MKIISKMFICTACNQEIIYLLKTIQETKGEVINADLHQ